MKNLIRSFSILTSMTLILAACSFLGGSETPTEVPLATPTVAATTIELTVQTDPQSLTAANQVIKYTYTVKNTGAVAVPGPVTVTGATCPELNTIGNQDALLDAGESVACTSQYTVMQADVDKGSIASITTATVSGINSNSVNTTVSKPAPTVLNLTKTASPVTYDQLGQTITYNYVIMNSGATPLGPAQFVVTDTGISSPINCGDAAATIAPAATLNCSTTYTISQADLDAGTVKTSATVSGGGAAVSPPSEVTLTKGPAAIVPSAGNANLVAGSTIQHKVVKGEWLWQIARCYGADPAKTLKANPQLSNPGFLSPDIIVTVPNIGSAGKIYGTPCVGTHTVQSGDTWNSIALTYNADPLVLQIVNKNVLTVGQAIIVPLNSASTASK